jgi:3-methyl-2-oxobutanoate hydroxymethyltransferase
LLEDAVALEEAGAFALVIEGVPHELATEITREVAVPTIGIGAGVNCDGQVLVVNDVLGLEERIAPKFVKRFAELGHLAGVAVQSYVEEVRGGTFPTAEHSFAAARPAGFGGKKVAI